MASKRWATSVVLMVLAAALAFVTVPALYLRTQVLTTDRYVETVAPLAADPAIQAEVAHHVTEQITRAVDVERRARDALTELTRSSPLAAPLIEDLVPVIAEQTRDRIDAAASRFVASPEFQDLWIAAHRQAHQRLVGLLTGQPVGAAGIDDSGAVTISTAEIIAAITERLVRDDVAIASRIPQIDAEITLFQSPELVRAGRAIKMLDQGALILAGLAVIVAASAVAVAPGGVRLRALGGLGFGVAVAMVLLALAVAFGRGYSLNAIPPERVSPDAAARTVDTLLAPLQSSLRLVFAGALGVMLGAFLAGRPFVKQGARRGMARVGSYVRGRTDGEDFRPWRYWLARSRSVVDAVVAVVAMVVLMLWEQPTAAVAIWTVVAAGAVIVVIELLTRSVPAST